MIEKIAYSLFVCCVILGCKGQPKEIEKPKTKEQVEQKKRHWWELPQYVAKDDSTFREVMKGREEKYQQALRKIYTAGLGGPPDYGFNESDYSLNEMNLIDELYYEGLKVHGFQPPSEEIFAKRIKEIFDVDIEADYTANPRVVKQGQFLILISKLYINDLYEKVPMLRFKEGNFIIDLKNKHILDWFLIGEKNDDYNETYYDFEVGGRDVSFQNYIFYDSEAGLNAIYTNYLQDLIKYANYDNFPSAYDNVFKKIQRDCMQEYKEASARTREGWDYRMYDRLFFSRGFDGKLKVKKKMLAAAVELAQEEEAYIQVPLGYYFIQMTTDYIANEYAAADGEVNNYFKECEPYYTPEERAMIWVYTALLELNIPPKSNRQTPYDFISLATQYPNLYEVAKTHDFFGEDMQEVLDYLQ
ncbi:hypothetical protein [Myroides odoratus]|uniref:hypothetical protein n=1 Tax=Myroides odoratus TaxID=256 RepID=UPI0039B0171B